MARNRCLPFGYRIRDGEYVVHEQEAECIHMAYLAYAMGASYQSLADRIQELGVFYHADTPEWNKHMVKRILENERYIGSKEFPAILSYELFDRVKRLRESKRVEVKKPRKKAIQHPKLLPPVQAQPVRDIQIVRLDNQLSHELAKPVLEPERLREMIFAVATRKYEAHYHAQEIKEEADADSVRFPTGSFVLNKNCVFIGTQYDISE